MILSSPRELVCGSCIAYCMQYTHPALPTAQTSHRNANKSAEFLLHTACSVHNSRPTDSPNHSSLRKPVCIACVTHCMQYTQAPPCRLPKPRIATQTDQQVLYRIRQVFLTPLHPPAASLQSHRPSADSSPRRDRSCPVCHPDSKNSPMFSLHENNLPAPR